MRLILGQSLIRALTLDYENDLGRLFENIVYLDLRRLGCKVNYYLTSERYEVDFLAQSPRGHKKLFQVAWDVQDAGTVATGREGSSGCNARIKGRGRDHHPRFLFA